MESGLKKLDRYIQRYEKFVISTHESPDGDGLGAEIAFRELLENLGKKAVIINSDPVPDTFSFIDIDNEINVYGAEYPLPDDIDEYAQFVLDTNDYDNIGTVHAILKEHVVDCFIIDHHEGDRDKIAHNFIKADASSACEIVYGIIQHYGQPLSFKAAQAIYAGMLFDTGSFRYPKTSSDTYRVAAHTIDQGADPFAIYEHIYESNSLSSFELRARILATMDVLFDGKMIAMKLTPEMIRETGALFAEGEISINLPLTVRGVVASLLVKQDIEGPVKVSMRTKGNLDVAEIAMANGGGGHRNAAGYKPKLPFDEAYDTAVKNMEKLFVARAEKKK